jgi:hypothetical protein
MLSTSSILKRSSKSFVFQEAWPFGAFVLAKAPSPRINFSLAFSPPSKIILYGGEDPTNNVIYEDLFVLQVKPTKLWLNPTVNAKTRPPPLGEFCCNSITKLLDIIIHFFQFSQIIMRLVFLSLSLSRESRNSNPHFAFIFYLGVFSFTPIASGAAVSIDSKTYIFGGRTKEGLCDDMYVLNEGTHE